MGRFMDFEKLLEKIGEVGVITEINHTVVTLVGLPGASLHELVYFEGGAWGEVFVLEADSVLVLLFENAELRVGTRATRSNSFVSVPVGTSLLGHIINPLGYSIEHAPSYKRPTEAHELDVAPPTMSDRVRITQPFLTGTAVVDMMVPLGKGQRELVIGDRKTGKSAFVLSTVKNQVAAGALAVYAAIGKRRADIKEIEAFFKREGILDRVVIVATSSMDAPGFIYLTPYSAMTIAEYFKNQGQNVVVVFDDLSTHARFYREASLLAKRFPGRESYPGDIFAVHARLLERAGNFKKGNTQRIGESEGQKVRESENQNSDTPALRHSDSPTLRFSDSSESVSITALPLVELVQGDLAGYIPTNLMSITDGHIYFDSNVYYQGRRPAVNISLSVTRVGRQAQTDLLRRINRELTAFLALYEKMQNLSHFGAELTDTVQHIIKTGEQVYAFFKQPVGLVIPINVQIVFFGMLWLKFFDGLSADQITKSRDSLTTLYQHDPKVAQFIDSFVNVKTFNDLLGQISKRREELMKVVQGASTGVR